MKRNIPICKTLCFPCFKERIMTGQTTVYRNKNVFSFRSLPKLHIIAEPAFQSTFFIIIRSRAFSGVFFSAFESINIKFSHIITNAIKIFHQFTICHIFPLIIFHKLFCRFPHLFHHRYRSGSFYIFSKTEYPPEELRTDIDIHRTFAVLCIDRSEGNIFSKAIDKHTTHTIRKLNMYFFFISLIQAKRCFRIGCHIKIFEDLFWQA